MRFFLPRLAAICAVLLAGMHPCLAAPLVPAKRSPLESVRLDPKRQTLLYVPDPYDDPAESHRPQKSETPLQFADTVNRRVYTIGSLTAFVPRTMLVIATHPGKPDPFADLLTEDRLLLLFSQWTPEQWAKAGTDTGIGADDLDDEQKTLFTGIFPAESVAVRTFKIEPDETHGEVFAQQDESETVPANRMRLQLSRRVSLHLSSGVGQTYGMGNNDDGLRRVLPDGTPVKQELILPNGYDGTSRERDFAYGVRILSDEPSRLKPGHLAFDAPRLQVPVRLSESDNTVGKLVAAVAKATRLEMVADRRYAALPVVFRGNRTVAAGDLLKALCRSVNGTFRKLPNTALYILTDDVDGYGTRLKRLSDWGRDAYKARDKALYDASGKAGKTPITEHVSFQKSDPLAPTDAMKSRFDAIAKGDISDTEFAVSDLPPAFHDAVQKAADLWKAQKEPVNIRTDTVIVGSNMRYEWVLPDGRAFPIRPEGRLPYLGGTFPIAKNQKKQYQQAFAPETVENEPIAKLPAALKRRVVILPLPETDTEVAATLAGLCRKGFTEAWFRVPFAPDVVKRVRAAVNAGKVAGVKVGASVGWLKKREANEGAPDEVTITGDSADAWAKRELAGFEPDDWEPHHREIYLPQYTDWVRPQTDDAVNRAAQIAAVPGLCGLIFENTAAPGYAGISDYNDGLGDLVRLGYHNELRTECVRAEGFDPVDVGESIEYVDISMGKHPFDRDEHKLTKLLAAFRNGFAKAHLAAVWKAIRAVAPTVPLYLPGLDAHHSRLNYFVRWDTPERFPVLHDGFSNSPADAKARAVKDGAVPLFAVGSPQAPSVMPYFGEQWKNAMQAATGWSGFVYDIAWLDFARVRTALDLLPDHKGTFR